MRHLILSGLLILAAQIAAALEIEDHAVFGPAEAPRALRILSTADIAYFEPVIAAWLATDPGMRVDYTVASSSEVMRVVQDGQEAFDLAISSAMDLQTKLANDGLAQAHFPDLATPLPDWAVWNDRVFSISQEPATIVVSNAAFAGQDMPRDRQDLIALLRRNPEQFRGRIGTYDIRRSGLGYLFATQDSRRSETYWRLTEVMGGLDVRLYCCSSEMIEDVRSGKLALAYNVLGSYAAGHPAQEAFTVILPDDFTTVMQRTMIIPTVSDNPGAAAEFVDFVLRLTYESAASPLSLPALFRDRSERALHRIRLGPGLLVFLDQFKKRGFLREWENATLQD